MRMSGRERREQLISVGRTLFAEKGFEAVSVEEVAATAGVSKPVVYEHFGGKEGLYAVVVDREMNQLLSTISGALQGTHPRQLLEQAGMALFDYIDAQPDGFRILVRDSPVSQQTGSFASLIVDVAGQVARVQVLPLLIGMGVRHWQAPIAERLEGPLDRFATMLLLLLVILVLLKAGPLLLSYVPSNLPALALMALMALASLALGGAMAGEQSSHRLTTALVTSMRNPGLALLFASQHGGSLPGLKLGVLVYVLVTVILTIPLMRSKRLERP